MPRSAPSPASGSSGSSGAPRPPTLDELRLSFEQGNYARLRQRASEVDADDTALVEAARALVERTQADPKVLWLFTLSGLLLLAVAAFAYGTN